MQKWQWSSLFYCTSVVASLSFVILSCSMFSVISYHMSGRIWTWSIFYVGFLFVFLYCLYFCVFSWFLSLVISSIHTSNLTEYLITRITLHNLLCVGGDIKPHIKLNSVSLEIKNIWPLWLLMSVEGHFRSR